METSFFSFMILTLLISINSITLISSQPSYNSTTDEDALLAFKNSISDPNSVLINNWSTNTSICNWTGVSCSVQHRRATALNLSGYELRGTIAPHLGNLTFLQSLDISSNNFTGSIPSELSKLRRLKEINVGFNNLIGEIPSWFGALSQLQQMHLNDNKFSGGIPVSLFNISGLQTLNLAGNGFTGAIPGVIGNLTMLRNLFVNSNLLEGDIPSSIFNISSLEYVGLSSNSLSGSIPTFFNSPKLEELNLGSNHFTGSIPKEIGFLTSLKELVLSTNNLTGLVPKQVGNLTSLIRLDLAFNKLSGELPGEVGNLAYLEIFGGPFNDFLNGSIPASIFNISTLKILGLQQNQFSGSLPPYMGLSLPNLELLFLYFNRLTGEIPSSINNASKLIKLELNRNSFTGSIPDFGNLRLLQALRLWENNLTGEESPTQELRFLSSLTNCRDLEILEILDNPVMNGILPSSIGNLSTSLVKFLASNCSIRGVIPSEIGNLTSLQTLDLSDNQLTEFIPTTTGKLKQLHELYLFGNQLQGYVPRFLCQISNLEILDLSGNNLTGSIPECLGGIKTLREVYFASNKLNSTLPSNFLNLPDLINLDLSSNYLSGRLPYQIGSLRAINSLDLSSNKFSGDIPNSIGSCKSLEFLCLSNNKLNGSIPQSLGEAKGLRTLDLSNNDLSGSIPKSLENLHLEEFNVSFNQLEGEIPDKGCFVSFTAQSFLHNSALCGTTRFQVRPCIEHPQRSTSRIVALVMKYIVPPFIAFMILVVGIVFLIRRCRQKNTPPPVEIPIVGAGWKIISERELKQGTSSFSDINLLGKGSMGSVYRYTLSDGEEVAVKVFNLQLEGATKSFDTESHILSTIRHRNLVKVRGCCSNVNTGFKALILAYMPNGSLEKWLHSDKYWLVLEQRVNITIDVALALEYLHHDHTDTVVHCDIKPNNVLLDADMTAHVGDFGIAKLFGNDQPAIHTVNIGTIGYAAPEFGLGGKVSTSGDVYSYGILLLEMFTSKKPTDDMFNADMSIKEWVGKTLQEKAIGEIVAPGLLSRDDPYLSAELECVSSIFELAMKCLASSPEERINMMQVVVALHKIKAKVPVEDLKKKRCK